MQQKETISLSALKSSSRKKNIDGKELRDFGNGKMEFDPEANGFFPSTDNDRKSDKEAALELFDQQLEARKEEVRVFNDLIDKYDGVLTEEDYRRETGQTYITGNLGDTMTDEERAEIEAERAANRQKKQEELEIAQKQEQEKNKVSEFPSSSLSSFMDDEEDLDELEKEILAEEDNIMPVVKEAQNVNMDQVHQQSQMHPMATSETFVDPNIARLKNTVKKEEQVMETIDPKEEYVPEEEYFDDEDDELENEIMQDEIVPEHIETVEKLKKEETTSSVLTGKVDFIAPKQQEQIIDENGMSEEEKDLAALDDDTISDDMDDDDTDSYWKKIGVAYNKKVKPVIKKLDLNATVVSSEPVSVSTLVNNSASANHTFKWVLPVSGRPYMMKSFTAAELNSLGNMAGSANRAREIIKAIWDHMLDGRGDNFDQWCKVTSHKDLVHLWFGVYGSCFDGANYVPYVCNKCKEATISDNLNILDMVEYKNDEVKSRVEKIRSMEFEPDMGKVVPVSRIQVSDSVVIDFKDPSIYDILTATLIDRNTREKYPEGSAMVPYISNIYFIDYSSGNLVLRPLASRVYPGNEAKTLKRKAIEYSMVIRSLNTEQYSLVSNYIASMSEEGEDDIKYVYPEYTCDHCHETIEKVETAPSEMVFTRHRLALIES